MNGLHRRCLAEEYHDGGCGYHHYLYDDVHLQPYGAHLCDARNDYLRLCKRCGGRHGAVGEGEVGGVLNGLDGGILGQDVLEAGENNDDNKRSEEHEYGVLCTLRYLLVERRCVSAIDVLALNGVLQFLLELRVFVQVLASLV